MFTRKTPVSDEMARISGWRGCHLTERRFSGPALGSTHNKILPLYTISQYRNLRLTFAKNARNIVSNDIRKLPNDQTTVRSDSSESVAEHRHVGDGCGSREYMGKLKQGAVAAGARNDTNAT